MSIEQAKEVLRIEAEGLLSLIDRVGESFARAVEIIYNAPGRVILTGIGKSGLICHKIAATMSSTGTPALFLHPVEALHGDLGMVTERDVLIAVSNSGETEEVNAILPAVKEIGSPIIAMTGAPTSTLARLADEIIDVGVAREACPLGLAPTASTTAALAMGDALAVCLLTKREFNESDFQALHPGGRLGQRLNSVRVSEIMVTGEGLPLVAPETPLESAIKELDVKDLGHALVVDEDRRLVGILADGDLRRALCQGRIRDGLSAADLMTTDPKTVDANALAVDALDIMERFQITALPITDTERRVVGVVHLHDILGRGSFRFRPTMVNGKTR